MTRAGERLIAAAQAERDRLAKLLKEAKMNTGGGTGC
jgi:hypothetical protein